MSDAVKLGVVNNAMGHLGEPGFATLEADPAPPKLVKLLAQLDGPAGALAWVLSRHPWLCALTYETLEPSDRAAGWKFQYVFDLPDTFVKVWHCSADEYEVGSEVLDTGAVKKVLRSNDPAPNVSFTEAKPYAAYSTDVLNVVALEAAARSAGPIQDNYGKGQKLKADAKEALGVAESGEAGQVGGDDPVLPGVLAAARREGAF